MNELKKNQLHTVEINSWSSDGAGVCRIDGRAVFVAGAIPGERWVVRILKVTETAVYAKGEELLEASPYRMEPDCPHYRKCGGCPAPCFLRGRVGIQAGAGERGL